jgi:hypothetical protein
MPILRAQYLNTRIKKKNAVNKYLQNQKTKVFQIR